jgi:hypothetical protein
VYLNLHLNLNLNPLPAFCFLNFSNRRPNYSPALPFNNCSLVSRVSDFLQKLGVNSEGKSSCKSCSSCPKLPSSLPNFGSSLFPVGDYQENRLARRRRDAENTAAMRENNIGTQVLEAAIQWNIQNLRASAPLREKHPLKTAKNPNFNASYF